MICTKCNNEAVLSSANQEQFYYCRSCKEEVQLEIKQDIVDDFYQSPASLILNYHLNTPSKTWDGSYNFDAVKALSDSILYGSFVIKEPQPTHKYEERLSLLKTALHSLVRSLADGEEMTFIRRDKLIEDIDSALITDATLEDE